MAEGAMARPSVAEERREEILAAFETCIVRKGLAGTTLADVAEEAGQARSLVRYFVGNRASMVGALMERLLEKGSAQLRSLPPGPTIEETLDLLLDAIFEDQTTNIVIMELWHLSLRNPRLRKRLSAIYKRLIVEIAALSGDASKASGTQDRAFAAVSLAFGTAFFRHLGLKPDSSEAIRKASRYLLTGDFALTFERGA